jgi:hypothetical protein
MTLTELKEDIRDQISALKECVRELKKTECEGIDRRSGHYSKTGKFDMMQAMNSQVYILEVFLAKLNKVKRLRRAKGER